MENRILCLLLSGVGMVSSWRKYSKTCTYRSKGDRIMHLSGDEYWIKHKCITVNVFSIVCTRHISMIFSGAWYHVHSPYIVTSQLIMVLSCTCDMTSSDQLSPIVIGCVGLVGILLSFSAGRSRVGPNTVARLWRDILFTLSLSAILETKRERAGRQEIKMISVWTVCYFKT